MAGKMDAKIAIIFDAGIEGVGEIAQAVQDLVTAQVLQQHGATVRLLFDGPGVAWLAQFRNGTDPLAQRLGERFQESQHNGLTYEACRRCAEAFGVRAALEAHGDPMTDGRMGHPCIAALVAEGYHVRA